MGKGDTGRTRRVVGLLFSLLLLLHWSWTSSRRAADWDSEWALYESAFQTSPRRCPSAALLTPLCSTNLLVC